MKVYTLKSQWESEASAGNCTVDKIFLHKEMALSECERLNQEEKTLGIYYWVSEYEVDERRK